MPIFDYVTKDLKGQYHKGEVEASSQVQAANLLKRNRLIIISIKPKNDLATNFYEKYFQKVSFSEVVVVTRQLATMVSAGLILSEALDILAEQQPNKKLKKVLEGVSSDIKGGLDFATSLEKYPDVFPDIYAKLVRAGQVSGKLDVILQDLATNLEKERAFQSKIRGAMIYPAVVIVMMVGVALIMVFFIIPKLTSLYKEANIELPLPTQILLAVTGFALNYWWLMLAGLVTAVFGIRHYISTPVGRLAFDKFVLKVPIINKIINLVILTNFTRTFALLTSSGISILDAIKVVSDITGNLVYKNSLDLAYQGVERGLPLSTQLLGMPVFPKLVGQMIKTGEETGKLDDIMFKLADYFESEADNMLKNITTIIEPVVLVILGVGVAFLVMSVILPIYQLTTSIK